VKKKSKKKLWLYKKEKRWLSHGTISTEKCTECNEWLLYFDKYDANCCPWCNIWSDSKCSDTNCEFCANRPETPKMGLLIIKNEHFDKKDFFIRKYSQKFKHQNRRELSRKLQCNIKEKNNIQPIVED